MLGRTHPALVRRFARPRCEARQTSLMLSKWIEVEQTPARLCAHPGGPLVIAEHVDDGSRQARRVAPWDQQPRAPMIDELGAAAYVSRYDGTCPCAGLKDYSSKPFGP